jgi:hypothetical protein
MGDSQVGRNLIQAVGWMEAGMDGETLFIGDEDEALGDPGQAGAHPEAVKPEPQLALPTPRENAAPAG